MRRLRDLAAVRSLEQAYSLGPAPEAMVRLMCLGLFGVDPCVSIPEPQAEDAAAAWADWAIRQAERTLRRDAYFADPDDIRNFAQLGWDVTDGAGAPLRCLDDLCWPLMAALMGEAGARLPPEDLGMAASPAAGPAAQPLGAF